MIINFADFNRETVGSRNMLAREQVMADREELKRGAPMHFLPVDIEETWLPDNLNNYGTRRYKIAMYGTLPHGESATVVIHGVNPMFEIRVPKNTDPEDFRLEIVQKIINREAESEHGAPKTSYLVHSEVLAGKGIKKYNDHAHFVRLHFRTLKARRDAITQFRNYETAYDDLSCYYRVVFRNLRIAITKWLVLQKYRYYETGTHPYFHNAVIDVEITDITPYTGDIFANPLLLNDRTIHCAYDIETYDSNNLKDEVPLPHNATAGMYNIGMVFTYKDTGMFPTNQNKDGNIDPTDNRYDYTLPKGYIRAFNITRLPTGDMPNRTTILCRTEHEMFQVFCRLFQLYRPNLVSSFNGDDYDWKWIMESARKYQLVEFMETTMSIKNIAKYRAMENRTLRRMYESFSTNDSKASYEHWTKYQYKINAELTIFGKYIKYPGYVNLDIRTQLRKMQPAVASSLKSYLASNKIGSKVDMPINELFDTFQRALDLQSRIGIHASMAAYETAAATAGCSAELHEIMQDMVDIAEYCVVDCARCQDLIVKTNIVGDRREIASMCYISVNDAFYYADGMKVRNSSISKAHTRGLRISNVGKEQVEGDGYPGAYVFDPKKGKVKPKLHPEYLARSMKSTHAVWKALGSAQVLRIMEAIAKYGPHFAHHPDTSEYPECFVDWLKQRVKRPVAGLAFSRLYPSIIMTYHLSPEFLVKDALEANELVKAGKTLHPIVFSRDPTDDLDMVINYAKSRTPRNERLDRNLVIAWTVRSTLPTRQAEFDALRARICNEKDFTTSQRLLEDYERLLVDCEFGFFGTILVLLFDERAKVKKLQAEVEHEMEQLQLLPADEFAKHAEKFAILDQQFKYYKSKQLALKVLMNTFYGETGNSLSSLYFIEIAGGITSAGQNNIKMVARRVQELACDPYYGDTDSVYISMPDHYFDAIDHEYYSKPYSEESTMAYYRALVEHSFDVIKIVQKDGKEML